MDIQHIHLNPNKIKLNHNFFLMLLPILVFVFTLVVFIKLTQTTQLAVLLNGNNEILGASSIQEDNLTK